MTQPDRPAGRGMRLRPSPVKARATELGLTVHEPQRLDAEFVGGIARLEPHALVCVSYGKILPASLLRIDGMTPLNIHPSLLPAFRGASPIQTALRDGCALTGVTIQWMADEMDAGDIALQRVVAIGEREDFGALHDRLALVATAMLADAVAMLVDGMLPRTPQDASKATYCRPIRKEDLRIDASAAARDVINLVRSASPSPGAWTVFDGVRIKVLAAHEATAADSSAERDVPSIDLRDGRVGLDRVVPEGRREMSGVEFAQWLSRRR